MELISSLLALPRRVLGALFVERQARDLERMGSNLVLVKPDTVSGAGGGVLSRLHDGLDGHGGPVGIETHDTSDPNAVTHIVHSKSFDLRDLQVVHKAPSHLPAFVIGQVVKLRSGGPRMTILHIEGDMSVCGWGDGQEKVFPLVCLEPE